jgi:two-component system, OmpR family, osmolarity sensor histidine kinase EnvZ
MTDLAVPLPRRASLGKRLLPRRLLPRSLLIILTPLVLLQIVATWFFFSQHYDVITKRLATGIAGGLALVIEMMSRDTDGSQRAYIFQLAQRTLGFRNTLEEGVQLPADNEPPRDSLLEHHLTNALEHRLSQRFTIDANSYPRHVEIRTELPQGVLRTLVRREQLFSDTTYIFVIWMVGASIVLFGVAYVFMRNQVRPIRRLAEVAEAFGKGQDARDFKPEGATEVRQASTAFLRMRARIQRQIEQRTTMLAGVSHDLRTPLTRMKLELALMPPGAARDSLATDVAEMEHMIDGYLAFARGEGLEQAVPTDLGQLVTQAVEQAQRGDRPVHLTLGAVPTVTLRPAALKRALANLIENGLRHGKGVWVTLALQDGRVEIVVDDDGPGVPEAQREAVFRPFFRLEAARDPNRGGAGLGLTIARDIARGHGGDLTLEAAPQGGLRARLKLPL